MATRRLLILAGGIGTIYVRIVFSQGSPDTNPEIIRRSLADLEKQLHSAVAASDAASADAICRKILERGAPATAGGMNPSYADAVSRSLKARTDPAPAQKGYLGFWLLRALAAEQVDDSAAGREAASVLKTLHADESTNSRHRDIIAGLNEKGWFNPPNTSPTPSPEVNWSVPPPASESPAEISIPDEFYDFFERWWRDQATDDAPDWAGCFSNPAHYGDYGVKSRSFIEIDRQKLINKYSSRKYDMVDKPTVHAVSPSEIHVSYTHSYSYEGVKHASGTAHVTLTVELKGTNWEITRFDETVSRD